MRVSALGFARIRDNAGRYCLLLNRGRLKHNGIRILSPIGGGFEAEPIGMAHLLHLGASHFEGKNELRFRIPDQQIEDVISWFNQRIQRETSVGRELAEELTSETTALTVDDLTDLVEKFSGFSRYNDVTARTNVPDKQTAYLIDVFDVRLSAEAMRKLLVAASQSVAERWVYFVSCDEMAAGVTHDGVAIGPISHSVM